MPTNEYYLEHIDRELTTAHAAIKAGNDGKARVCARRAAGLAITWYLSKYSSPSWGIDAMTQLLHLKGDASFLEEAREAAQRLTTKISDRFTYPFSTNPIEDALIIIEAIRQKMEHGVA